MYVPTSLTVTAQGQEHRPVHFDGRPLVMDVLLGETMALPAGIAALETIAKPANSTVTQSESGRTLTLSAVGRYHLRGRTTSDVYVDLSFCVCEQAAHDWIHDRPIAEPGHAPVNRRAILRSLATYEPRFDGTRGSLIPLNLVGHGGA